MSKGVTPRMSKLKRPLKVNATPSPRTAPSAERLRNVTRGDGYQVHTNNGHDKPDCGSRDSGKPWDLTDHRLTCNKCQGRDKGKSNPVARNKVGVPTFTLPAPAIQEVFAATTARKPRHAVPDDLPVVEAEIVYPESVSGPGQQLVATTIVTPATPAAPEVTVIEDKTWTLELSKGDNTLTFEPIKAETYEDACRAVLQQVTVVGRQTREVMSTGILARLA